MSVELVPSSIVLELLTSLILGGVSVFELGALGESPELRLSFFDIVDLRRKGMAMLGINERGRRSDTKNNRLTDEGGHRAYDGGRPSDFTRYQHLIVIKHIHNRHTDN